MPPGSSRSSVPPIVDVATMVEGRPTATRQSGPAFGVRMSRAMFKQHYTVKQIEDDPRINAHFRWCAYTGMFKSKDLFSPQQLLARADWRYCENFTKISRPLRSALQRGPKLK